VWGIYRVGRMKFEFFRFFRALTVRSHHLTSKSVVKQLVFQFKWSNSNSNATRGPIRSHHLTTTQRPQQQVVPRSASSNATSTIHLGRPLTVQTARGSTSSPRGDTDSAPVGRGCQVDGIATCWNQV
jgi:hypothetical protein